MSVIGIVCELNPFHNGHKFLIDSVKKNGDIVVCVMSGNFVQRCEPAFFNKETRVKAALTNGADIVLELPFIYATASAQYFAENAVRILDSFGCDKLAFGTEGVNVDELNTTAEILLSDDFSDKVKEILKNAVSYPVARQKAFEEYGVNFDISTPNNILAIEYAKAIKKLNSKMNIMPINRVGAGYNDMTAVDGFASATHIRQLISDNEIFSPYVPKNAYELYIDEINDGYIVNDYKYNSIALALLRTKSYEDVRNIAYMSEGLENRIVNAVRNNVLLDSIYDTAKTKRFTHSRIRRAVLAMMFGITAADIEIPAPYCRLLGFNTAVSGKLGELAKQCKLPFIVNYADFEKIDSNIAKYIFDFECKSTDIYNLSLSKPENCLKELIYQPVKI